MFRRSKRRSMRRKKRTFRKKYTVRRRVRKFKSRTRRRGRRISSRPSRALRVGRPLRMSPPQAMLWKTRLEQRICLTAKSFNSQGAILTFILNQTLMGNLEYTRMYYYGVQYQRMRWIGFKMYIQKISDKDFIENKLTTGTYLAQQAPSSCKLKSATDVYFGPYASSDTPSIDQLNTMNSAPNSHTIGRKGVCVVNYTPPQWHNDGYKIKTTDYLVTPSGSTPPANDLRGMLIKFAPVAVPSVQKYTVPNNISICSSLWPCLPTMDSTATNASVTHACNFKVTTYFKFAFYGSNVPLNPA